VKTPSRQRDCRRSRRGFTLFEILIILAITAGALVFATRSTSGQSSYYYLKGDVDRLVSALQRAVVQSASRGELSQTSGVRAGVTFYLGRTVGSFTETSGSHSYLNWFEGDPLRPLGKNLTAINLLTAEAKTQVRALNRETILVKKFVLTGPTRIDDQAYVQYRDGKIDIFNASGTVPVSPYRTQLQGWFTVKNSVTVSTIPVAYEFDVVNLNAGWVRVRMFTGGFVQVSGVNPLDTETATNAAGGAF
jgi:Tfp pilus assembly protein FimT